MTKRRYEDYMTGRIVIVFAWSALLLWGMTWLQAMLGRSGTTYYIAATVNLFLAAAAAICTIFGCGWYIIAVRRGGNPGGHAFNGALMSLMALVLLVCCGLLLWAPEAGIKGIYVLLPLWGLLHLIYLTYPREAFVFALTHSAVILCLVALYRGQSGLLALAVGLAVCILTPLLFLATRGRQGRIAAAGVSNDLFGESLTVRAVLLIYGVTAAALLAAFFLGHVAALTATAAALVFLLTVLIRATVRLMEK